MHQQPLMNAPQRDMNEMIALSAIFGTAAYLIFFIVGSWALLNIPVGEFHRPIGFLAQWAAGSSGFSPSGNILDAPRMGLWPTAFKEKVDGLGDFIFYPAMAAGSWLGWLVSAPQAAEILLRGREVSTDARAIQKELNKEGAADGILIHPALRISRNRERQHFLILGQTGAGKTQILLPLIGRAVSRGDRCLIFDYKGDLTATTTERVAIIAPWDRRGWAWDIAADVRNKQDARALAAALIQETGKDPFWSNGARSLLVAMLVKLQAERGFDWTWGELAALVPADLQRLYDIVVRYNPEGLAAVEEAGKTTQSLRMTLASFLSSVFDLADAWDRNPPERRVSLRRWMIDPPDHYPRSFVFQGNIAYEPLMKAYVHGILRAVQQIVGDPGFATRDHGIWMFLDEFIQLGKLDTLLPLLEVARGKGVRVALAAQDFARIQEVYGDQAARALLGTVATKIFGCTSGTSAQDYSDLLGDQELKIHNVTFSSARLSSGGTATSGNQSTSYQTEKRPAFAASQFGTDLGQREIGGNWYSRAVLFYGGQKIGVLDWPRVIWPETRPAAEQAEWLTPGWPHRKDSFLTATKSAQDDDGREIGSDITGPRARVAERPLKPAASPVRALEERLPTDKAADENKNPLQNVAETLKEKAQDDFFEEAEAVPENAEAMAAIGMDSITSMIEAIHKVGETLEALGGGSATPGPTQNVHVARDDEEEEERKAKRRREQQQHRAAEEAGHQLDLERDGR